MALRVQRLSTLEQGHLQNEAWVHFVNGVLAIYHKEHQDLHGHASVL